MAFALKLWLVILAVGGLNYLSRLSFIAFFANRGIPRLLARALKYVPAAMLTALVVPMILVVPAVEAAQGAGPRIVAAIVAVAVAYFTHSTLATLAAGMSALWGLRAALGA
jgi:branched-subunit amino acid transport protein